MYGLPEALRELEASFGGIRNLGRTEAALRSAGRRENGAAQS